MNKKYIFVLIVISILLQSCGTRASLPELEPSKTTIVTPTSPVTPVPSNLESAITTVAQTPVITQDRLPVASLTPTDILIQPSPIPTLPEATAQARIEDLLKTNANCRLPCWWGITPGTTNWYQASQILDPLVGPGKHIPNEWGYFFPNDDDRYYINQHYFLDGEIVNMIEITFGNADYLSLPEILTEYGPPTEIYIRTFSNKVHEATPFYLILFYADQGILARFESNEASLTTTTVQMCFRQESIWGLVLWSPGQYKTYWEVAEIAITVGLGVEGDDFLPLLPIEDATVLDPNSFFTTFKDIDNPSCLETPADLWPGQFE